MTGMVRAGIRPARSIELDAAADTLAEAFDDYPWTRWVVPEDGYAQRLRTLQRLYLAHAQRCGLVAVTDDLTGVVALLPAAAPAPEGDVIDQILSLHGDRASRLGAGPTIDEEGAWTLETLGVARMSRGRGLGGALIEHALDAAASRGAGAVLLETSDERNVDLYRRHGFVVVAIRDGEDGPPVWLLRCALATRDRSGSSSDLSLGAFDPPAE